MLVIFKIDIIFLLVFIDSESIWFLCCTWSLSADQLGWICWPMQCYCSKIPEGGCCKSKILKHLKTHINCPFLMENELLEFISHTWNLFAAILFRKSSINLSFTFLWKVESLHTQHQIWIHDIHYSHSKSSCRYCRNNGMSWIIDSNFLCLFLINICDICLNKTDWFYTLRFCDNFFIRAFTSKLINLIVIFHLWSYVYVISSCVFYMSFIRDKSYTTKFIHTSPQGLSEVLYKELSLTSHLSSNPRGVRWLKY